MRFTANFLYILTWVILVIGVAVSVLLGIFGSTLVSRVILLLGGLVATGVSTLMLFAISRLINLFIDIEEDLKRLNDNLKKE